MIRRLIVPIAGVALILPALCGASAARTRTLPATATTDTAPAFAYVASDVPGGAGAVNPIGISSGTAQPAVAVGSNPQAIAITPDGRTAYVVSVEQSPPSIVTPIFTATNAAAPAIRVGSVATAIAITPNSRLAYVVNQDSNTVTPIDTVTNTPEPTIAVASDPAAIAITPNGNTAYVTSFGTGIGGDVGSVTPISTTTNTAEPAIPLGGNSPNSPVAIAITPNDATAYVVNSTSNTVTPISTATNTPGTPIPVGNSPNAIAITPSGKSVYVTNFGSDTVTPINIANNTAETAITVGPAPRAIAITPASKTAYVVNSSATYVTPINTTTNTAGTDISLGGDGPYAITIPERVGLVVGQWPGTAGPGIANVYYGYPYPDPPACTDGGSCVADKWHFYEGQCTSWVAYRINQLSGVPFNNYYDGSSTNTWGDASNWGPYARSLGIPVNTTPSLGSVAWYSSDHVAYVEWVNSPTSVVISEMNYDNDNGFRVRTITTSNGWPTDFIHIPGA